MEDNASNVVRAREEAKNKALTIEYDLYRAAMRGTVDFLLRTVEETWYRELTYDSTFYSLVTPRQILALL